MAKLAINKDGDQLYRVKGTRTIRTSYDLRCFSKEYIEAAYEPVYRKRTGLLGLIDRALGYYK